MNQLDFVSDNLLSTNDAEVIAKKRENLKKIILSEINVHFGTMYAYANIKCAESILEKTFDAGVVN